MIDARPNRPVSFRILFLQGFQEIVVDFKDDLQVTARIFYPTVSAGRVSGASLISVWLVWRRP